MERFSNYNIGLLKRLLIDNIIIASICISTIIYFYIKNINFWSTNFWYILVFGVPFFTALVSIGENIRAESIKRYKPYNFLTLGAHLVWIVLYILYGFVFEIGIAVFVIVLVLCVILLGFSTLCVVKMFRIYKKCNYDIVDKKQLDNDIDSIICCNGENSQTQSDNYNFVQTNTNYDKSQVSHKDLIRQALANTQNIESDLVANSGNITYTKTETVENLILAQRDEFKDNKKSKTVKIKLTIAIVLDVLTCVVSLLGVYVGSALYTFLSILILSNVGVATKFLYMNLDTCKGKTAKKLQTELGIYKFLQVVGIVCFSLVPALDNIIINIIVYIAIIAVFATRLRILSQKIYRAHLDNLYNDISIEDYNYYSRSCVVSAFAIYVVAMFFVDLAHSFDTIPYCLLLLPIFGIAVYCIYSALVLSLQNKSKATKITVLVCSVLLLTIVASVVLGLINTVSIGEYLYLINATFAFVGMLTILYTYRYKR